MEPLNTNSRAWLMYAGELEDHVKDNHLAMRTLVGPFRKGVRLYPMDLTDPLAFEDSFEARCSGCSSSATPGVVGWSICW